MAYLYKQKMDGKAGTVADVIRNNANIPKQDTTRFRVGILFELCEKNCITYDEMDTSTHEGGRRVYKITQDGEDIIKNYRNSLFERVFGSIDNDDSKERF